MNKNNFTSLLVLLVAFFIFQSQNLFAQSLNTKIDNFEYDNADSLKAHWRAFGYSTLDFGLTLDTIAAPLGVHYLRYDYSGNDQTTWGGALDKIDLANSPLDFTGMAGVQFYLKGDGTSNKIYVQFSNGDNAWSSNLISLADTNWHVVRVPFNVEAENGFTNGAKTYTDFVSDLGNVTDFRIFVDHPAIDNTPYTIYFDEIFVSKFFPPETGVAIADFENYRTTDELKIDYQFFGYSTLDYNLKENLKTLRLDLNLLIICMLEITVLLGAALSVQEIYPLLIFLI